MNFLHPAWAAAGFLPLFLATLGSFRKIRPAASMWLKAAGLSLILFALAEPETSVPSRRTAVVALLDRSRSISEDGRRQSDALEAALGRAHGSNMLRSVSFARGTESAKGAVDRSATDLESALLAGIAALPPDVIGRIVLASDGNQTAGSYPRALFALRSAAIPVQVMPLDRQPEDGIRLTKVQTPAVAFAGEQIPLEITVEAPSDLTGKLSLQAEDKDIGQSEVSLHAGENHISTHARINFTGAAMLSGVLETLDHNGQKRVARWTSPLRLRRARLLYLSEDPAGTDTPLLSAFAQAGFEIVRSLPAWLRAPSSFHLAVLNNLDLKAMDDPTKRQFQQFVRDGGGLLLIGGERLAYKEEGQQDALDRTLPAQLAPPQLPEGAAVALIVDKSSSMEGRKIELARSSAIGVVEHLRPRDSIGVLIFDNSYQWAVPIRRAEDKALIRRLISGITPDGGTQIAPALAEGYKRITKLNASSKHIVLLTDGISEEGDSIDLAAEANRHSITISTVGLGQDVNRAYLEKVASVSGGKSYFLNDPSGLEQILLKDVQDYSASTAVERDFVPLVAHPADVVQGIDIAAAPALKGYARFDAKQQSDVVLRIDPERRDPLYMRWQYGLGRAAIFASDAKSRWAQNWIGWPGYDRFWINAARDLLPRSGMSKDSIHLNTASETIEVEWKRRDTSAPIPPIFAIGPGGFQKVVQTTAVEDGRVRGRVAIGNARGLFRIRPLHDNPDFEELGLYRGDDEDLIRGADLSVLQQISSFTGGRVATNIPDAVNAAFNPGRESISHTLRLWPAAIALAIVFSLVELVIRKWASLSVAWSDWREKAI